MTSQAGIVYVISQINDNLHLKNIEIIRFEVTKFFNITRLIHEIWDEMVIMIVIEKDMKMETIFEAFLINVDGLYMFKAPKNQRKEVTMEEKRKKMTNNLIMKKYPKGFNETECKHVDKSIRSEFSDCFPLRNKPIEGVKVPVDKFMPPLGRIMYHPSSDTHKNEIKHIILMFHYID